MAGTGEAGYGGDGGRATDARFDEPKAVESTGVGGFLVADSGNDRVRMVSVVGPRALAVTLGSRRSGSRALRVPYRWGPVTALDGGDTAIAFRATVPARARLELSAVRGRSEIGVAVRARKGRGSFPLPPTVEPGLYRARLTAASSDGQHARATGTVRVTAPPALASAASDDASSRDGIRPAPCVLGAAGLALIAAAGILYRRHRRLVRIDRKRRARRIRSRAP